MKEEIVNIFGNRLRIRVCGILVEANRVLLVLHKHLGPEGSLWAPPGGGMEFGMTAAVNLEREFREETGLEIRVKRFLFLNEFLSPPLHSIEMFFEVGKTGGTLLTGTDPEMTGKGQIIEKAAFLGKSDLQSLPDLRLHEIISFCREPRDLLKLSGFYFRGQKADFNGFN